MERVYTCNICHEKRPPNDLFGLKFADLHNFRVVSAGDTDGSHICHSCMDQLQRGGRDAGAGP